jgi:hypothetical protein
VTKPDLYGVVGSFNDGPELVEAARAVRELGYTKLDAFTPFPVHGIDDAMAIPRSPLGWIVLCAGFTGAASALLLIWWTGAISYPLVVGGKPLFALEFSIPVTFELTVLFSAFAAVFGMFALNRLPQLYHPVFNYSKYAGATDDKFLLAIEATDPKFNAEQSVRVLTTLGAQYAEVVEG